MGVKKKHIKLLREFEKKNAERKEKDRGLQNNKSNRKNIHR